MVVVVTWLQGQDWGREGCCLGGKGRGPGKGPYQAGPRGPWLACASCDSVWGLDSLLVAPAWPLVCWVTWGRPLPLLDFSFSPPTAGVWTQS